MAWLRDVLILLGGLCIGSLINWAIYSLAYDFRPISPWWKAPPGLPPRSWLDCLPLLGWWRLRREAKVHGRWFWVRPILIELCYAGFMLWLFHFETSDGLLPRPLARIPPAGWYSMFAAHAILIALITAATFIDFDEQTIPDMITLPGAILLLILTTVCPKAHLPQMVILPLGGFEPEPLLFNSLGKAAWPPMLDAWPGLLIALAILWCWWLAMLHGVVSFRYGWERAVRFYAISAYRSNQWRLLGLLFLVLSAGTAAVWSLSGQFPDQWHSLYTSLVGLAFAGGLVWGVRVGGYLGLRKEAMGFGDVTLMTMIGVTFGWQASLLVFFLSPVTAVVVAVAQFLITGRQDIAFGPYLSLAAVVVIVWWVALWEGYARPLFAVGGLIPLGVISFLLLMTGMLMFWRMIKEKMFGPESVK
jgi:prepilin signal peptidase PulO-like enzyme (type II secretory pathway)